MSAVPLLQLCLGLSAVCLRLPPHSRTGTINHHLIGPVSVFSLSPSWCIFLLSMAKERGQLLTHLDQLEVIRSSGERIHTARLLVGTVTG